MPTFSALTEESDDVPDESEAGSNMEEEFDPFLNGGAEPPVNNSAMEPAKPVEVAVPEVQEVQPEKNAALKTVDSSNIGKVRDAMISDFSLEDAMISNSLSETCNWQLNGDRMTMYAENNFVQVQLSSEVEKISAYLSEAYGRKISIEIKILEKKETEEKVVLPKEVEVLCDVFRGSLLGSQ